MPNLDELKSKTSTGGGYKPVDDTVKPPPKPPELEHTVQERLERQRRERKEELTYNAFDQVIQRSATFASVGLASLSCCKSLSSHTISIKASEMNETSLLSLRFI